MRTSSSARAGATTKPPVETRPLYPEKPASKASQNKSLLYFDVFASTEAGVCQRRVELITTQRPI